MLTKPSCALNPRQLLVFSLVPLAAAALYLAKPAQAADACDGHTAYAATIESVSGAMVKLYGQPKPGPNAKEVPAGELVNQPVKCQAKNRMLGVDLSNLKIDLGDNDNKVGWLFPHKVKTNVKPVLSSRCVKDGSVNVGATRAIGEGCK